MGRGRGKMREIRPLHSFTPAEIVAKYDCMGVDWGWGMSPLVHAYIENLMFNNIFKYNKV